MGRREENKAAKRSRLEGEACRAFLEHGFAGASVERIAAAAGVARGTFYLYFEDKRELYTSLVDSVVDPLCAEVETARDALVHCDSLEATLPVYVALGARLGEIVLSRPDATRLVLCEARSAGPGGEVVRGRIARLEDLTRSILDDAGRRGLFRPHDGRAAALAIVGAIERLAGSALSGDSELALAGLPREIALLFRHGLEA